MGKVSGNWVTGSHSGSACHHDSIYTKVNKKTGACYSVKLCNPNHESNATQLSIQNAFALVSKAVSAWIKTEKEANSADYKRVKALYDGQYKYATLRGFMIAKGMYTVAEDKATVTVDVDARSIFKTAFGIDAASTDTSAGTGGSSSSSGTGGSSSSGGENAGGDLY